MPDAITIARSKMGSDFSVKDKKVAYLNADGNPHRTDDGESDKTATQGLQELTDYMYAEKQAAKPEPQKASLANDTTVTTKNGEKVNEVSKTEQARAQYEARKANANRLDQD